MTLGVDASSNRCVAIETEDAPSLPVRILVNATTITVGGGVQAAVSFVEHAARSRNGGVEFLFALSPAVEQALAAETQTDTRVRVILPSPAHPLRGLRARRELQALGQTFSPHVIYSLGFPSYVRFGAAEIGRYTNGWEICATKAAMASLPLSERLTRRLKTAYRLRWARTADYFETQTEVAKAGIVRRLGVPRDRITVIPNSVNPRFLAASERVAISEWPDRLPRVLCLSAAFRHKNLTIIPEVAHILREKHRLACTFVLTLPEDSFLYREIRREATKREVGGLIDNVGPLNLDGCVREYSRARVLFLPTLFEIFSATYIEAMAMGVPIITTDLDFARDICHDAALYYEPLSADAAANAVRQVVTDRELQADLVGKGLARLKAFPDPKEKHEKLIEWLKEIARQSKVRDAYG